MMNLSWDEKKRQKILLERGLDFAEAEQLFAGAQITNHDDRMEYGEVRNLTYGFMFDRLCVCWYGPNETAPNILFR